MAQKTDLNINPYYDDFDSGKNFYKVLFKPGFPVQARELTTLQSILQNQIESFGSYTFKEGTVVIPGNITYDGQFYAVKLNAQEFGIDVSLYIDQFVGKKVTGQTSGTTATIQKVAFVDGANVQDLTIYVKYVDSNNNFVFDQFEDGESLVADQTVTYGNTTIVAGTPFASLVPLNATSIGSAASIGEGVYFVRGYFANVSKQTIILDNYTNTPSYRVGLSISELLINAKDDSSLFDNAKGFTNFAAPGADRLQINLTLTKKLLVDKNDTDFIELLRVEDGRIKKIENKTQLNRLGDYIAERTYEESGHYALENFDISLHNSLNDKLGNDGLFFDSQTTEQLNPPSDDLMCVKVSPGEAYVAGYNVEKVSNTIIDVEKPRDTATVSAANIPFEMGNLLRVNNVIGAPAQKESIDLYDTYVGGSGTKIGDARVYTFNLTGAAYQNGSTNWDLYLYDVQTYTTLTLNTPVSPLGLITSSYIKGKSSGASGYAVSSGSGSTVSVRQTSGTFSVGEQLIINGVDVSATVTAVTAYGTRDIKSVLQSGVSGFPTFTADSLLDSVDLPNGVVGGTISGGNTLVSPGKVFTGVRVGDIIRYQTASGDESFNKVTAVSTSSLTIGIGTTVSGVSQGTVTNGTYSQIKLGVPALRNQDKGYLYAELPDSNIESVNLSGSTLKISEQITGETTDGSGVLTFDLSAVSGISSAFFDPFDEERYSVHYTGGGIGTVTSDAFSISSNTVTINGLFASESSVVVNTSLTKNGIQSKIKEYTRSSTLDVVYSKNEQSGVGVNTSINDGLTYNTNYGLRVQDEEISLNYPDVVKVLAIFESLDENAPTLDQIQFFDSSVVTNAIIGENVTSSTSNTIARVVSKPTASSLSIVYLNKDRFSANETVTLEESNSTANLQSVTSGSYKDVTASFTLDKGQKEQYYDYSRLVRSSNTPVPSRRLKVVFDHYTVPTSDNGDVYTVLSYGEERFAEDIPLIGSNGVRATDTLDFRPRVSQFTVTNKSPFDFDSRSFGTLPKVILKPKESSLIGYNYYLPRIDKVYLDVFGNFTVQKGISEPNPKVPTNKNPDGLMDLGTITLPAYLYDPTDADISLVDNRRYTMRDIGKLEDRIETLERVTSLSLLEVNTQTLQVQDAQGNNRFKTGFFVDDFKNNSLINLDVSSVEVSNGDLTSIISDNSLKSQIAPSTDISEETLDLSTNFDLLDSNVQKTGSAITLKYDSVGWIEQPLATKVENVNPFHVVSYNGFVTLSPSSDSWVRTVRLPDSNSSVTRRVPDFNRRGTTTTFVSSRDVVVSSGRDVYMRSRNTQFSANNLKPLTKFYQFFDGNGSVDFIPKLLEISNDATLQNYGSVGSFEVGETVTGYIDGQSVITFRLCSGNHKQGTFNSPSKVFNINPYIKTENLSAEYSQSSKVLNVDTFALSEEAQGKYSGYVVAGVKLVGQTSGAVAYVKDLRLISDNYGDLFGSFFLRDPFTVPAPAVRITTGTKTYKLTNSSTNAAPLPGSKLQSTAEISYKSEGRFEVRQRQTTRVTANFYDPLAQSFSVGGTIDAPDLTGQNNDANGAYLTAVDLFFANKPSGNDPVRIEVRTVELGTPTRTVIGTPVTLRPDDITTSTDGTVATKATFDYPIYLAPGQEYAIVAVAETTDEYELWIAEMGEKTVNTATLPDAEAVIYSKQFALGSLFKSQNGSIWTANQYQDLKFKLYKANFTSTTGTAFFYNPTLDESNGYVETLDTNPITTLPKTTTLGITTIAAGDGYLTELVVGRRIAGSNDFGSGHIVGTGSSVHMVTITDGGANYAAGTYALETTNIVGTGSGLILNVTADATGTITAIASTTAPGNGYQVGDVVGVTTTLGRNAQFTIQSITGLDTLYLGNVQGEKGASKTFQVGAALSYYNDAGTVVSLASTTITDRTTEGSGLNSGNYLRINHFDHGMYYSTNKVVISDVESTVPATILDAPLTIDESTTISVASTANFTTFEGQTVSGSYLGYVKVGDEIISYNSVGSGTLSISARAVEGKVQPHDVGNSVTKYEFNGVSLRRINGVTQDVSSLGNEIDQYHIAIDMSTNGNDRSNDGNTSGAPQLSFASESSLGGENCKATENIQFNEIVPNYDVLTPSSSTSVTASVRTTTGRSVDGSETPFVDNGFENVELNEVNRLSSVRMVASSVNEENSLTTLPRNKSFTTGITLNSSDPNLSPIIYTDTAMSEFRLSRLNQPITDYPSDNRVNSLLFDPHSTVYVSNTVNLTQEASSLKVILAAYRHESADFRVLYNLIRADSSEVTQEFELFPGYDNLKLTGNGLEVVNSANNSGRSDTQIPASLEDQYLEYEFTANNLDLFTGYTIKIVMSGTNQAQAPRIKDLRTIALR
jgi:hypothetical protein